MNYEILDFVEVSGKNENVEPAGLLLQNKVLGKDRS